MTPEAPCGPRQPAFGYRASSHRLSGPPEDEREDEEQGRDDGETDAEEDRLSLSSSRPGGPRPPANRGRTFPALLDVLADRLADADLGEAMK
jgi:hypothetical protein